MQAQAKPVAPAPIRIEACILAGGLSARMGHDKARLVLDGRTLLSRVRAMVRRLDVPVRIIRRDLVPRCGPLGGVYTALRTSKAEVVLFLSCDMPFVTDTLVKRLLSVLRPKSHGVFTTTQGAVGFPFLLKANSLPRIEELLARKEFSLQSLAQVLKAKRVQATDPKALFNINTPEEWTKARQLWRMD